MVLSWGKLDVVNAFTYFSVLITRQMSLNKMAHEQSLKSKRVLIIVLSKLYLYGQMSRRTFLNCLIQMCRLYYYMEQIYGALNEYHVLNKFICMHVKDACVFLNMQQTLQFMVTVDEYLNLKIVWSVYLSTRSEFLNLKIISWLRKL